VSSTCRTLYKKYKYGFFETHCLQLWICLQWPRRSSISFDRFCQSVECVSGTKAVLLDRETRVSSVSSVSPLRVKKPRRRRVKIDTPRATFSRSTVRIRPSLELVVYVGTHMPARRDSIPQMSLWKSGRRVFGPLWFSQPHIRQEHDPYHDLYHRAAWDKLRCTYIFTWLRGSL